MSEQQTADRLLAITRDGLMALGYTRELLRENYPFVDLTVPASPVERVPLAAFAQEPPSYRTACFGVALVADGTPARLRRYASLGAPQLVTLHPRDNTIGRWMVRAETEPELLERLAPAEFQQRLIERQPEWNPQEILRAKTIKQPGARQLDFFDVGLVPMLESAVQSKLDELLREVLADCQAAYHARHRRQLNYAGLYRLIFRLIAAKLLGDREHPGPWTDSDADQVIEAVKSHYFARQRGEAVLEDANVRQLAWDRIRTGLHLQNLSVETLAYVYENTLVDPHTRSVQDIHATPRELAEYIVNSLPFELLPQDQRTVFEPFAGHAPFLIAAMSRLRGLLPGGATVEQRHDYCVRMLAGMEIDAFALEVARYSLMLADYPNPNGWNISAGDVFASPELDGQLKAAQIVLCNPPFGDFSKEERAANPNIKRPNKAAETLRRVLEHPPTMLGLILPRSFTQGPSYRQLRERFAALYSDTSLLVLPEVAFRHSRAETVIVIAHGRGGPAVRRCSAYVSKRDYPEFLRTGKLTWDDRGQTSLTDSRPQLWTPPLLRQLLESTQHLRKLEEFAEIHRGVEYKEPIDKFVSDQPKKGYVSGLKEVRDSLEPYLTLRPVYLRIEDKLMRGNAHELPWHLPKAIANAARLTERVWAIEAAPDRSGLVCSQNFHGIWPTGDLPIEALAAILAGPVANAVVGLQITSRGNQKRVVGGIPIPALTPTETESIVALVREYQGSRERWLKNSRNADAMEGACRRLLLEIDAAVLAGYDFPPRLEREVLDRFAGEPRPGPVRFEGYYPPDFVPAIPLWRYLSAEYRNSAAHLTLKRLKLIDDPAISAMIEELS
jgi:hypothetical protein